MSSCISGKDLQKARRNAERKRASVACARCKAGKIKCSDYRPCKKCKHSNLAADCVDGDFTTPKSADSILQEASSDVRAYDASMHEWCMGNSPYVMQAPFPPDDVNTARDFHSRPGPLGIDSPVLYFTGGSTSWAASGPASVSTSETVDQKNTATLSANRSKSGGSNLANRPMLGSHASMVTNLFANSAHISSTHGVSIAPGFLAFLQTHLSHSEANRLLSQQVWHHGTTSTFQPIFPPPFPLLLTALQTLPPPVAPSTLIGFVTAATPRLMAPSTDSSLMLALLDAGTAPHPHRRLPPIVSITPLLRR